MTASMRRWLFQSLPEDVERALDRLTRIDDIRHVAVMPDVHLSYDVCVGTVIASRTRIYPQAVGGDIGCGMAAIRFECDAGILDDERAAARLLAALYRTVPAVRHSRATMRDVLPEDLETHPLSHPRLDKLKSRDGRVEFATLGRGNHFLEFQRDEEGRLWLMLHSGSRALGPAIRDHHLAGAGIDGGLRFLEADSDAGRAYLADMQWALSYADASRRHMVQAVADVFEKLFGVSQDAASVTLCNHNHARREVLFGESFWVHRKGAISAREGEEGIIPGSMGTPSFHVRGRGVEEALCSSSHGAGRVSSRTEARQSLSVSDLKEQMRGVWFDHRLAPRLRDEAPSAYKDIGAVMRAQRELTRVVRKLTPVLSYKGA